MNNFILPQRLFLDQAIAELHAKFPRWCEWCAVCFEQAQGVAARGVTQIGEDCYSVPDNQIPTRSFSVTYKAQTCECEEFKYKTELFEKPCKCSHRVALYIVLRAHELDRAAQREAWEGALQQFLTTDCSGQPRVLEPLIDMARRIWNMQSATLGELKGKAKSVRSAYDDNAAAGEDAGIRSYVECLPLRFAIEYQIASFVSQMKIEVAT